MPKRVLSIGRDLLVLETRNLIIKSAGYEVVTTQETGAALLWLHNQHFDAAVIGDQIDLVERVSIARQAKAAALEVPLVVFARTWAEVQTLVPIADYVVEGLGAPADFVNALRTAVGELKAPA